ncbi:DUF4012 domain-containing protein [Bifidobacterium sp. LC6]|uniref:DUF4012 domain-containing protein n=1 Tax=Bifidobacterium colobi TaxID=2809026 RepID=A0ABS5UYZ6_9BIFI|nr:DUF4012 domain-containing protein [Bifidobacterium colobi]MBT1175741.1 DUF4012 domain-containing protein [Bifidobacterium colobi]
MAFFGKPSKKTGGTSQYAGKHNGKTAHHAAVALPKKHHVWPWIVLVVVLTLCAALGALGYSMYRQAMSAKAHLNTVIDTVKTVKDGDLTTTVTKLDPIVNTVQAEASAAKSDLSGWQWDMAEKVPVYGSDIKSVRVAVDVLDDFSHQTLPLLNTTVKDLMNADLKSDDGQLNTKPIITAANRITKANNQVKAQSKRIENLPDAHIGQIQTALSKGKTQFSNLSGKLNQLTGVINMLPPFIGSNGARNYVLIAQTNSEIRSTGGLIGSVGSVHAENGKITVGDFHSNKEFHTVNVDQYVQQGDAELYDSIWPGHITNDYTMIPDFPQLAQYMAENWKQESFGGESDGVMSMDPVALQALMGVTGSVTMPDGRVLDGTNAAAFLLNGVYQEVPVEQQDAYFALTASQTVHNMFSKMDAKSMLKMAKTMMKMAEKRHLYFWSFHKEDQRALRDMGVSGEVTSDAKKPVVGMYLNDTKATKIDYYIDRKTVVTKTGTAEDGSAQYHVQVTFTNTLPYSQVGSLATYIVMETGGAAHNAVALYAPVGGSISNIATSNGDQFETVQRKDRMAYNGRIVIEPASSVTLDFDVTTAPGAASLKFDQTPMIRDVDTVYEGK